MATSLNCLARLLVETNRLTEAKPLLHRALAIFRTFAENTGYDHPHMPYATKTYRAMLEQMGLPETKIRRRMQAATGEE